MGVTVLQIFPDESRSGYKAVERLHSRIGHLGAVPSGMFSVDCETYYCTSTITSGGIQTSKKLHILHNSETPVTTYAIIDTGTKQVVLSSDLLFDLLLPRLSHMYQSKKNLKIESKGYRFEIGDFVVKVGTVTMSNVQYKGILVEELGVLCENQPVYVVEKEGDVLYGLVTAQSDDLFFISSFQTEKPKGRMFSLTSDNNEEFDLIIDTDGTSPRARNFIYLCSGLQVPSYKGKTLILNSDSSSSLCLYPGPPPVVDISDGNEPRVKSSGFVTGMNEGNSWFSILLKSYTGYSQPVIGIVTTGFNEINESDEFGQSLVKDCGLVI